MSQSKWESMEWTKLGRGSYNEVYLSPRCSDGKRYVLKVQRADLSKDNIIADKPARSVRIWNQINPLLPAFLVEKTKMGSGWICPYVSGVPASDQEISYCLIDIFYKTGRIVADAPAYGPTSPTNFIKTPEKQIICIDVGMALQMEERDKVVYKSELVRAGQLTRIKSVDSLTVWKGAASEFPSFFQVVKDTHPKTTRTIKALIFLKANRPDILDAYFLKESPDFRKLLSEAYDGKNKDRALAALDKHKYIRSISPDKSILSASSEERKDSSIKID